MSRVCVLVDDLRLPGREDTAGPSALAWSTARQLAASAEVTLLQTDSAATVSTIEVEAAARHIGCRYLALAASPPAFDVPLFPSAEIHARAHHVAATLRALRPDFCLVIADPALAAIAIDLKRVGADLTDIRFAVIVDRLPREQARLQQDQLPSGGREEIVHDFLERRALSGADRIAALNATAAEALRRGSYGSPDRISVAEPRTFATYTSVTELFTGAASAPAVNAPRVSICVPYFEQPQFLASALESLAAQTLAPHEVIVMDDGSTSVEGRSAFAAAERTYAPRGWKFLRQANAGPAAARNRMVESATGDAVLFCDTDNRFRPEMVATMASAFAATGADCVTCGFRTFIDADDGSKVDPGYVFSPLADCVELGLVENVLGDTNFLVRRDVFRAQGGFAAERLADEDWQFLLRLLLRGGRVETVPAVLFEYRRVQTSRARRQGEFASAAITLRPILAETTPAWRRLWPHLVSAIRNPQVPVLEHQLAAQRLQLLADVASVQQELAATRRALRRERWEKFVQKASVDAANAAKQQAESARAETVKRIAELEKELEATRREQERAVTERDDKIRRMQSSWSWQATAPVRAARRAILDPLTRRPLPAVPAPVAAPRIEHSIDQPTDWDSAPTTGAVRGWCLIDGSPAAEIRAQIDGAPVTVNSCAREDVARARGLKADATSCGFEVHYRLAAHGEHRVVLEARAVDGRWHVLHETTLRTTDRPRDTRDYTAWVESFGTVTAEKARLLRDRLGALTAKERPLISVVMPVHNAPERWLRRAIESVREQVYDQWELCIADDASTATHVRAVLTEAQQADPRVRVVFRAQNGHISAASNSALELARGEFIALLDHDDELAPDALAETVLTLAVRPDADVIYSDEDKIDESGRRSTPYFKPDFLPDLLLGQNCISHLALYRTSLVRKVGGFRIGYEGSQDWDLALRVIDATSADRVVHVPKVLYHWRMIAGSTAVAVSAKNYSVDSARRALRDHFQRRDIAAEVQPVAGDHWRIVYPLPDPPPLVTIVIPTRDRARLLRTCVGSIFARTEYARFEVLIVDNGSTEEETKQLFAELSREEDVRVVEFAGPFNFSAINNFAAHQAKGSVLCFLNNDIEVITGRWLDELVSHALRPEIGAVGAMLYYPNNTIQHAGVVLGLGGVANHAFLHYPHGTDGYMNRARLAQNYSAVTAACLVVRRDTFMHVGGFNERDLAIAFNDIDLCLRIRALGLRNLWTPFAELYHHESASRGNDNAPEHRPRFVREIEYMRRTWGPLLDRDPAYNPNLALDLLGWQLAWPPRA